jgi:hypothetical protein
VNATQDITHKQIRAHNVINTEKSVTFTGPSNVPLRHSEF